MMKRSHLLIFLVIIVAMTTQFAFAELPDLPRQELWVKIVSLIVGLIVIFSLCILGIYRILTGPMGMEADTSTRMSIILGIIFSFLWFLYLFGQIFNTMIMIIMGVLIAVILLVYFIRKND